ncbi:MAG: phosphoglucosamine mutase, partial [Actinomycetia bacterium]|nr:phosphoglucosamine mutase [Actinomycetes bacterium]
EADLCAGMAAEGAEVTRLGVLPTPALAYIAGVDGAPAAMISASHNPWPDNGIKLFAPGGRKLDDGTEAEIERVLHALVDDAVDGVGDVAQSATKQEPLMAHNVPAISWYVAHLLRVVDGRDLSALRVVFDCANGAASTVVTRLANRLHLGDGSRVINAFPKGRDINDGCGSTHPEAAQQLVVSDGANIGLAFDGDADRVIAIDEHGALVDGDQIMVMAALDLHARGHLRNDAIAVTVMSNLGLRHALHDAGITVVETAVGDRNVLLALDEHDLVLGGEQSGHLVFREHATTGDGVLTGLMLLDLLARTGRPLSELAAAMTHFPQVLVSVHTGRRADLHAAPGLAAAISEAEERLGDDGRVLVRASGTEPVVRVMVEAATHETAEAEAEHLVSAVRSAFSTP